MIRILFTYIVPILLPTAVYLLWLRVARRAGKDGAATAEVPWVWLLATGVLLTALVLGGVTIMGEPGTDRRWVPAYVDDQGRLVHGHFE